jgi:hypothetical protein
MANGLHKYTVQEAENAKLGQGGYDIVTAATVNQTTNPNTEWVAITLLVNSTITTATSVDTDIWDDISGLEVPAGTTIYGRWNVITIGTGDTAICYRG